MTKKKAPRHFKTGRPPLDELDLFLHVLVGCRKSGLSVHAYCKHHYLEVGRAGRGGGRIAILAGETLRRHFYRVRNELICRETSLLGKKGELPAWLERMVVERLSMAN